MVAWLLFLLTGLSALEMAVGSDGPYCFGVNVTLNDNSSSTSVTKEFALHYTNLMFWRDQVEKFVGEWSFAGEADRVSAVAALSERVENHLSLRKFPPELVAGAGGSELPREIALDPMSAHTAVHYLLHNSYSFSGTGVYDFRTMRQLSSTAAVESGTEEEEEVKNFNLMLQAEERPVLMNTPWPIMSLSNTEVSQHFGRKHDNPVKVIMSILDRYKNRASDTHEGHEDLLRNRSPLLRSSFIVYQTRFVNTGGTTALNILHELLVELLGDGPDRVLLCNEQNHLSPQCANPPDSAIVISGEWCHEVLKDHGLTYHRGRGIQYHLGFHHYRDMCAGHVAFTDSHYLHSYLGERILGGYYWSCPMSHVVERELVGLMTGDSALSAGIGVAKENLVVIDPDFSREYRPAAPLNITLPPGIRVVYAENIPHHEMPLLLQRAKVVVDLAIPGPERLMGEGVLNGAIPICSSRWNGASAVDFPGVERVDAENGAEISKAIRRAIEEYPDRVAKPRNAQFFSYIASLRERTRNTLEVVASSASLHFVLSPRTLKEERECVFQTLALLHVFPLASVDILVNDEVWFLRQNYPFLRQLREAGYVREDPMEPWEEERVGVSGVESGAGTKGTGPQAWGKDQGSAWTQARWHHERSSNKAFVTIRARQEVHAAVLQQVSYEADAIKNAQELSPVAQSEISPSWGAVVVALPSGVAITDHRGLLGVISNSLGSAAGRAGLVEPSKGVSVVHPGLPLEAAVNQEWYQRTFGPSPTSSSSGGDGELDASLVHVTSLFSCPSLDHGSEAGGSGADITVVRGVVQSPAWLSLRSHYCNQMHP